jgi:nicotinamidase-related amidase
MQPEFEASKNKDVIKTVCREVRKAVRFGWHCFLVEYDCAGDTHKPIRDALKGYKNVYKVIKYDDDGSRDIMIEAARNHISLKNMRFCGVNSEACVFATIDNLLHEMRNNIYVEIVSDGCNSEENNKKWVMKDLKAIKGRRRNVKIL